MKVNGRPRSFAPARFSLAITLKNCQVTVIRGENKFKPWPQNTILVWLYLLVACVQTSPVPFASREKVPFPREAKEIGD